MLVYCACFVVGGLEVKALHSHVHNHDRIFLHMQLDLDAPRRMSSGRGEQLAFEQLPRITHRI